MRLNHGIHLGYCTNIQRGETWAETFAGLEPYTLAVKAGVGTKMIVPLPAFAVVVTVIVPVPSSTTTDAT